MEASVTPAQGTRTDEPTSAEAQSAKPAEPGGSKGTVTLRTRYPVDRFEHSVKGVDPITAQGTDVPAGKVKALIEAAESADTTLEEIE